MLAASFITSLVLGAAGTSGNITLQTTFQLVTQNYGILLVYFKNLSFYWEWSFNFSIGKKNVTLCKLLKKTRQGSPVDDAPPPANSTI